MKFSAVGSDTTYINLPKILHLRPSKISSRAGMDIQEGVDVTSRGAHLTRDYRDDLVP